MLDVSRELGATMELERLLKSIERAALQVLGCERATVFLYDRPQDQLYSLVATGVEQLRFPANRGIAGEAAQTRRTINVQDAYADSRFNPAVDRATGFKTRNLLTFPLVGYDDQLVGVMQVLNKQSGAFSSQDERLADTLSALAGVAIQRQLLLEEYAEKRKLERDLDLAREIQRGCLPDRDPQIPRFDVAGWNKPADQTGGDAYDFIPCEGGRLGLLIADATGHGVGPALMVAECRAYIRAIATTSEDPAHILRTANQLLVGDLRDGRFVTVCLGFLDPQAERVRYVSAGQGPLLHYIAAEDRFRDRQADTVPMGIVPELPVAQAASVDLAPGDLFILLTDGFFEWSRPQGDQFGIERVFNVVRGCRDRSAGEIIRTLHDAVVSFGAGTTQADDLTAIIIKRVR
jgi:phosphoserine phosphatase